VANASLNVIANHLRCHLVGGGGRNQDERHPPQDERSGCVVAGLSAPSPLFGSSFLYRHAACNSRETKSVRKLLSLNHGIPLNQVVEGTAQICHICHMGC
jgi:hypothetical protein